MRGQQRTEEVMRRGRIHARGGEGNRKNGGRGIRSGALNFSPKLEDMVKLITSNRLPATFCTP